MFLQSIQSILGSFKGPASSVQEIHVQPSLILESLTDKEAVELCKRLGDTELLATFFTLSSASQNHVFPLLKPELQTSLFKMASEARQHDLLLHLDAYNSQRLVATDDCNNPQSFFFWMKAENAFKAETMNKQTFILPASKLMKFDFKPYKYQRKLMTLHVQKIKDGMLKSCVMYHPLILVHVPSRNSLTIVDGQHRWNALKLLPSDILDKIQVQIDVFTFEDDDEEIMKNYNFINTNIPIDPSKLQEEMRYVDLVAKIKSKFGKNIVSFNKELDKIPAQFVVDTLLKEELQYRKALGIMKDDEILQKLQDINFYLERMPDIDELSIVERRACRTNNMYLGVAWPKAIELLMKP